MKLGNKLQTNKRVTLLSNTDKKLLNYHSIATLIKYKTG